MEKRTKNAKPSLLLAGAVLSTLGALGMIGNEKT